eukprot:PRCOL_00006139-RA
MSRATLAALAAALAGLATAVAAGADVDAGLGVGAGGIALAADGAVRPAEVPAPDAGVAAEAFAVADHVVALRRELHRVPAVVYEEHNASAIVRRELDALGVRYTFPVAITGVVAEVGEGEPIVLLRADLDGLPVHEEADGVSAAAMVHTWSGLPTGVVASRAGPFLAASGKFVVTLAGAGGHAALPHLARDPVVAAAALVAALQLAVSRASDPLEPVVLSVTRLHAGGQALNIIPGVAELRAAIETAAAGVAAAHGVEAEVDFLDAEVHTTAFGDTWTTRAYPPVVNSPALVGLARRMVEGAFGAAAWREMDQLMIGEDFAFFCEVVPLPYGVGTLVGMALAMLEDDTTAAPPLAPAPPAAAGS